MVFAQPAIIATVSGICETALKRAWKLVAVDLTHGKNYPKVLGSQNSVKNEPVKN